MQLETEHVCFLVRVISHLRQTGECDFFSSVAPESSWQPTAYRLPGTPLLLPRGRAARGPPRPIQAAASEHAPRPAASHFPRHTSCPQHALHSVRLRCSQQLRPVVSTGCCYRAQRLPHKCRWEGAIENGTVQSAGIARKPASASSVIIHLDDFPQSSARHDFAERLARLCRVAWPRGRALLLAPRSLPGFASR